MPDTLSSPALARRGVPAAGVPGGPGIGVVYAGLLAVVVLYFGRDLFIPLALAVLLSFVLAPVARALRKLRIGRAGAVLVSVLLAFAVLAGLGLAIGRQVTLLADNLPAYQRTIARKVESLQVPGALFGRISEMVRSIEHEIRPPREGESPPSPASDAPAAPPARGGNGLGTTGGATAPQAPIPVQIRAPEPSPIERVRQVAEPLLEPLAMTGIVIVLVVFILLYREDLRDRLIRLAGARDLHRTVAAMDDAAYRLSRFFLAQTAMNACFGAFIAAALWLIGVPNPILWGIIAGLMRFVPFVGSFIAVAGPLLLALAVDPGWSMMLWVAALFLLGELAMGQVFEPLIFGHSTGLSPIAVIAAATFWTWLWGPIGLLLAVPLTVCAVVLGRHVDRLEFLDVMLGDRPPLEPEETFYQRALAGDADALVEQADHYLRDAPLSAYYDEVALKGLALAQADWSRDVLDAPRLQTIRQQVETLLDDLADEADEAPPEPVLGDPTGTEGDDDGDGADAPQPRPAAPLTPEWSVPGTVLCIAGRGRLDDLPAAMLADLLQKRGLGARAEPNALLRIANLEQLESPAVRICVLSVLEGGSSAASANYFLRRIRRRLPGAKVVLGLWQAAPGSPMLAALRGADEGLEVVTSMREAVAHCLAAAHAMDAGVAEDAPAAAPTPAAAQPTPAPRGAIGPEPPPLERGGPLPDPEPA